MSKTNFAIFLILTTVLTAVLSAFIFSKILFAPVPEAVSKVNQLESSKSSFLLYPDLQKFNNCASSNLVIKQEYEFSKIKFLLVGTEQMCSSYNWYTQILKVMPDNSLKLVEASCGSAAQEKIYESPQKKY